VYDAKDRPIANMERDLDKAKGIVPTERDRNADRIVACVNALAGVEDPSTIPVLIETVRALLRNMDDGHGYPVDIQVAITCAQETLKRVDKPEDATIRWILDLSTAHVLRDEDDAPKVDFGGVRYLDHEYGWTVFVSSYFDECSEWLRPIMEYAHAIGAMIINFDSDAHTSDRFKLYEEIQ